MNQLEKNQIEIKRRKFYEDKSSKSRVGIIKLS